MRRVVLLLAMFVAVVALIVFLRRASVDAPRTPLDVIDVFVRARADASEQVLFEAVFGKIVLRRNPELPLHLHRHGHETWIVLDGEVQAQVSRGGALADKTLSPGSDPLYTPAYAAHAFQRRGQAALLSFVAAPDDGAVPIDKALLPHLRDAELTGAKWMSGKLTRLELAKDTWLGPFSSQAAIFVRGGSGSVEQYRVGAGSLVTIPRARRVNVAVTQPLVLMVFDPAFTDVSTILTQGERRYSQDDEELVIRDFFKDRKGGVFLDVGAAHYRDNSNTFYLEEQLGWSGVAVDALGEYAEDYRRYRKRTQFANYLVTDALRGAQKFYRAENSPEVSATSKRLAEAQELSFSGDKQVREREVPTITLDALLAQYHIGKLDFVSMDIEEHEPQALAGFDITRFGPQLVCVEAHLPVRDAIWRYFRAHQYERIDRYLPWDSANWYFTPVK